MQFNSSPKKELPRWIQEYLAREQHADGEGNLKDGPQSSVEEFNAEGMLRGSWKSGQTSPGKLNLLKIFALVFLLPGLGGLIFSAMVSTDYRENLPRVPSPAEQRMTPRNVHGVMIYQTVKEDKRLSMMEYSSVSVFLVGLLVGIFYLEKWSTARQHELETNLLEEYEV